MIAPGTPLPWSLAYGFDCREFGGETPPATYVGFADQSGIKLASPWIEGAWDDDPEAAANARYIVVACNLYPELVEALEAAYEAMGRWVHQKFGPTEAQLQRHNIDAVLAKAKPEALDSREVENG